MTDPFWSLFIRCVVNPAILLRRRFVEIAAMSSMILLLTWKSFVSLKKDLVLKVNSDRIIGC